MQEAVPVGEGAMAAVLGMERDEIEKLCEEVSEGEVISPANFNCPGQIVVAGHTKAVTERLTRRRRGEKGRSFSRQCSFSFSLMKPAGSRLEKELEKIAVGDLTIPVVTNVEAEINTSKARVKDLLVTQVFHPVRWEESMRRMVQEGIERVIEIGPGKVLSGLMRRIEAGVETKNLEDVQTLKKLSLTKS